MNIKSISQLFGLMFFCQIVQAQMYMKPPIDSSYFHWESADLPVIISPKATYWSYNLMSGLEQTKTVIRDFGNKWSLELDHPQIGRRIVFSNNDQWAAFLDKADTLFLIRLGNKYIQKIPNVMDYYFVDSQLLYRKKEEPGILYVLNPQTGAKSTQSGVKQIVVPENSDWILMVEDLGGSVALKKMHIRDNRIYNIWKGAGIRSLFQGTTSKNWYFISGTSNKLYCWNPLESVPKLLSASFQDNDVLNYESSDGNWLVAERPLKNEPLQQDQSGNLKVKVWSFQYVKSPANLHLPFDIPTSSSIAINIKTGKLIELTGTYSRLVSLAGGYALIEKLLGYGTPRERDWNKFSQTEKFLVDLYKGTSVKVPKGSELSPHGKYITYMQGDNAILTIRHLGSGREKLISSGDISWSMDDRNCFVKIGYDYWIIDPSGIRDQQCITNGYGEKKGINFFLLRAQDQMGKKELILRGQEVKTRANGFFKIDLAKGNNPVKLHLSNCKYLESAYARLDKKQIFCFQKQTSDKSPGFVFTTNFVQFQEFGTNSPQQNYNWPVTELHQYRLFNGKEVQGILYKPGNFDSSKKYPLIFSYYEDTQDWLHDSEELRYRDMAGPLNLAWMASHGYLVFIPHLINDRNRVSESALECLLAARDYIKQFKYIDSTKMGIAGHSFGGLETNYFIGRTNVFSAAYSSAGPSNFISLYGFLPDYFKFGQPAVDSLLWEAPQTFIHNSPLMHAHKVKTPILLIGNQEDMLWPQPKEFFNALRRLGKPSWLLQYDGQGHITTGEKDALDQIVRVQQFFDHYLKGMPAPLWMTEPGSTSLNLDPKNRQPLQGLLTPEAQKIADELSTQSEIKVIIK